MSQHCFIIHINGTLESFHAEAHKTQFLDRVLHIIKKNSSSLREEDKKKISKIADGKYTEIFPSIATSGMPTIYFGSNQLIAVYLGKAGVEQ